MKKHLGSTIDLVNKDERGAALVMAILSVLLVTILAFALVSSGMASREISQNASQQTEAFFISEAGLTHGIRLVTAAPTSQYTSILTAGDGIPGTGDELSTRPSELTPIPGDGIIFGSGRYRVFVTDDPADPNGDPSVDSNNRLVVTSIGTGRDGATVTTEAIVTVASAPAILVNGPLLINGNPIIGGSAGTIHSNGALTVSGTTCVSQTVSSTTTITVGGTVSGTGCSGPGVTQPNSAIIDPPTWPIRSFFFNTGKYDYVLGDDGRVRNQAGTLLHNSATQGDDWNLSSVQSGCNGKWTWKGSSERKWVHGGSCMPAGRTWYVAGNMELGSDFGLSSPVKATFIAEGYITVSAKPNIFANLEDRYAYMAGTDLTLSGDPASGINSSAGIHYAAHQIKFNGNPKINGVVIAANLADTNSPSCGCNPVPRLSGGGMEIGGNPTINYDGSLIAGQAVIASWREVRN
jgi:hypothetical protein